MKILGIGYCNSRGIKAGAVSNFEQVEQAVRQAFDSAEGHTFEVQSVVLSVSGGRIASESLSALLDVAGMVSDEAITRVLAAASPASVWNGRATLHCLPNSYSIDAAKGIHDPRKMLARRLGVDVANRRRQSASWIARIGRTYSRVSSAGRPAAWHWWAYERVKRAGFRDRDRAFDLSPGGTS